MKTVSRPTIYESQRCSEPVSDVSLWFEIRFRSFSSWTSILFAYINDSSHLFTWTSGNLAEASDSCGIFIGRHPWPSFGPDV